MKVTPLDLRQTHLSTALRGYDRDEVRTLLSEAADDFEGALREVDRLRQELQRAEELLTEYREREGNLKNTLLTAQKVADQIRENAGKEAEVLLKDAETRAATLIAEAETRSATRVREAEMRAASLLRDAEFRATSLTTEAEVKVRTLVEGAQARATTQLTDAEARAQLVVKEAESRAATLLAEAQMRADTTFSDAQVRADAMVKEAQARVDVLMQKANARLDELEHAVSEMRLRKRDVEGTLEQSIASLTYALEFVRTQDARDDKIRLLRPRQADGAEPQAAGDQSAAMLG